MATPSEYLDRGDELRSLRAAAAVHLKTDDAVRMAAEAIFKLTRGRDPVTRKVARDLLQAAADALDCTRIGGG